MSSFVSAGVRSLAGKITRSALLTRTSRPPASTNVSFLAMAAEDGMRGFRTVADVLPTPLVEAPEALAPGRRVFLKREDVHELGAFKWRGAMPAMEAYRARGAAGVVTASTGNHGAATAWAAQQLGMPAVVFAPERTSHTKLGRMQSLGADIRLTGADVDEAKDAARVYAGESGLPFFEDGA